MDLKRFALQAIERNPFVQAGKFGLGKLVRSDPFQHLRNAALERTPLGLPEKTFIKAMTGGDKVTPGGIQLSDDQLARLKQAHTVQKDPSRMPVVREFNANSSWFADMSPAELEKERQFHNEQFRDPDARALARFNSPYVTTYGRYQNESGYGRDLKMTLGGLSMTNTPQGMRIQDEWHIDPVKAVAADHTTGIRKDAIDRFDAIHDLGEGGHLPSIIANTAQALGTYEPIQIDQTIPTNKWNSIVPREATLDERMASNQGPVLQTLNDLYTKGKGLFTGKNEFGK